MAYQNRRDPRPSGPVLGLKRAVRTPEQRAAEQRAVAERARRTEVANDPGEPTDYPPVRDATESFVPYHGFDGENYYIDNVTVTTRTTESQWHIDGSKDKGKVRFDGPPAFSCRYQKSSAVHDEFSQELAIHDADRGRIFYDFRWAKREASGEELQGIAKRLMRAVTAANTVRAVGAANDRRAL